MRAGTRRRDCWPASRYVLQRKAVRGCRLGHGLQVANAPIRVAGSELPVERLIARGRVPPLTPVWAIEDQHPGWGRRRAAPAINAVVAAHGAMWIMLMHTTASAVSTGQGCRQTSRSSGARTLDTPVCAIQARMEARSSGSGSLGCHVRCGIASAKWTTCWPVPLAISSTKPLRRQNALQHRQDRPLVPLGGRCREWDLNHSTHV